MSESVDALKEFWEEMQNQEITLKRIEILKTLMSNVFNKIKELEESREKWKKKALSKSTT